MVTIDSELIALFDRCCDLSDLLLQQYPIDPIDQEIAYEDPQVRANIDMISAELTKTHAEIDKRLGRTSGH